MSFVNIDILSFILTSHSFVGPCTNIGGDFRFIARYIYIFILIEIKENLILFIDGIDFKKL